MTNLKRTELHFPAELCSHLSGKIKRYEFVTKSVNFLITCEAPCSLSQPAFLLEFPHHPSRAVLIPASPPLSVLRLLQSLSNMLSNYPNPS